MPFGNPAAIAWMIVTWGTMDDGGDTKNSATSFLFQPNFLPFGSQRCFFVFTSCASLVSATPMTIEFIRAMRWQINTIIKSLVNQITTIRIIYIATLSSHKIDHKTLSSLRTLYAHSSDAHWIWWMVSSIRAVFFFMRTLFKKTTQILTSYNWLIWELKQSFVRSVGRVIEQLESPPHILCMAQQQQQQNKKLILNLNWPLG